MVLDDVTNDKKIGGPRHIKMCVVVSVCACVCGGGVCVVVWMCL